jgi:hypothetical protein
VKENRRIFKHLHINDKSVLLPPVKISKNPLTVFIEIDDLFLHTFICDENFGYMANPAAKSPEHEFLLSDTNTKQPVLVYERDCMHDLLTYLKE